MVPRPAARHQPVERGSEIRFFNYRETTPLKAGQVDDSPYGGGAGMVMRVDVVDAALQAAYGTTAPGAGDRAKPRRPELDDALAERAGRRAGADPAVRPLRGRRRARPRAPRDRTVSIGRYVLSGGELAAMVLADAVLRKLPGALGDPESAVEESFSEALEGAPSTRTTPGPPSTGAGASRRSSSPVTTPGPRMAPGAEPRPRRAGFRRYSFATIRRAAARTAPL